ncbi:MAG: stage 0 sporulation family protein [Agathobacter sp.]|nr:stage 0 sporulation family protein [Agathobacter sp.]
MTRIVGIRFQKAGKIYYFDPLDYDLEVPMHVIVETARGVEMGTVLIAPKEVEDDSVVQPLKPVLRIATDEDERIVEENKEREKEAFAVCKERIAKHGLDMKLVAAEYTFDNNKLLFYFTADGRVDFRELVKDLASVFRTRIELRQIGVRDETKMLGGIGICGRELCCKSYMADFIPVSIKMAKEQNLSLNPTKISGTCGRLMCCLKNEQETYEYLNSRLPSVKDTVTTPSGLKGEVASVNVLRQLVKVIVDTGDEKELQEYHVDDLRFTPRRRKDVKLTEEELKELKELESIDDSGETLEGEQAVKPNRRDNNRRHNNRNRRNNENREHGNRHDGEEHGASSGSNDSQS